MKFSKVLFAFVIFRFLAIDDFFEIIFPFAFLAFAFACQFCATFALKKFSWVLPWNGQVTYSNINCISPHLTIFADEKSSIWTIEVANELPFVDFAVNIKTAIHWDHFIKILAAWICRPQFLSTYCLKNYYRVTELHFFWNSEDNHYFCWVFEQNGINHVHTHGVSPFETGNVSLVCWLFRDYFLKSEDSHYSRRAFEQNGINTLLIRSKLIMTIDFMNWVKCVTIIDVLIEFKESLKFIQK